MSDGYYTIYGLRQSYFTQQVKTYFDYKNIPYRMTLMSRARMTARAEEGWPRGIPAVGQPDGSLIWDSTSMMHYLDRVHPEPGISHPDPTQQFLAYLIEDTIDNWMIRHAVATRWYIEENAVANWWAIGKEVVFGTSMPWTDVGKGTAQMIMDAVVGMGVTEDTALLWIEDLKEWMRLFDALFSVRPYCVGERPSIADFAVAGASAAHFGNDPACLRMMEEHGPAMLGHMERLMEPWEHEFGDWCAADDVPEAMIALLTKIGQEYLPWVAAYGSAGNGADITLAGRTFQSFGHPSTSAERDAMLARYAAAKGDALDAILERAGILQYFDGYQSTLSAPPAYDAPPRPPAN